LCIWKDHLQFLRNGKNSGGWLANSLQDLNPLSISFPEKGKNRTLAN
jgi:hypothetical protein